MPVFPPKRTFSPYELTQLRRYGVDPDSVSAENTTPVEYLTGHVTFCNLDFLVTQDTLIPRIETEGLVDRATKLALSQVQQTKNSAKKPLLIADVGTGCGAIAICLSLNLTQAQISHHLSAVDVSEAAVHVAEKNAALLVGPSYTDVLSFFTSDLLTNYPAQTRFDLLTANLPYIPTGRIANLDESVKDHEPHLALDGGEDGLELIRQFLTQALEYSHPGTQVLLEVDYTHTEEAFAEFTAHWQVSTEVDEFLRQRFVTLTRR